MRLVQPFLSAEFAERARAVPLAMKVRGPDDWLRKHAVRECARLCGVPPDICGRRKKALQYGSGIHKAALKCARRGAPTLPPRI